MSIFSKLLKGKEQKEDKKEIPLSKEASPTFENKVGDRFLKLKDDDCGLVIHSDSTLEVVFTKFKNDTQNISDTEEALMALAVFIKQPGFLDLILEEFRKIATASAQDKLE